MNKNIIYVLAVVGALAVFYFLRIVFAGVASTANPNAQIQKAKCLADCRNGALSTNCDQYCLQKSLGN